ncbi:MAG: hypothetical protein JNM72_12490 [Deltaproteobacteria bacterium]|nr:hypothetical protein [Deltaproteobacteria bacterium]
MPRASFSRLVVCSALAAALLLGAGCQSSFGKAQEADTIEAYEQFLVENPTSPYRLQAETRIELLLLEKARAEATLGAYDKVIERFPNGPLKEKTLAERKDFLYAWADETDTAEAWDKFMTEYPSADKKQLTEAEKRKNMASLRGTVEIGPVALEEVNLAHIKDGPLDGWLFSADITNKGDKPVKHLMFRLHYLNAEGKSVDSDLWPVVATAMPGNMPMPDGFDKPMAPGETRRFSYETGDMPPTWAKTAKLSPVDIKLVE